MAERRTASPWLETAYERLVNEEDARVCTAISEQACRRVPFNVARIVVAQILTKTGDALINPKTVLAWLVGHLGAPGAVLGLLVPIRESGSLVPQIAIAAWVRRRPVRKRVWVLGAFLQGGAVAAIGVVAVLARGSAAGVGILAALAAFSLARGLCSVASKDVLGKTVPKTRRGRVTGIASGVSGACVTLAGSALYAWHPEEATGPFFAGVLGTAACLWWVAALTFATIEEEPGETEGGGHALREAFARASILVRDRAFARFVVTRALLVSSALAAPYYVALARRTSDGAPATLGLLVLAGGLAASFSAPIWGRLADRSSRTVLLAASALTAALGAGVFAVARGSGDDVRPWAYPAAFLALGIAHAGVRLGRKTYVIDMAEGNRRTDYVAVGNTAIGILLLVVGGALAALGSLPPETLILGLAGMSFAGFLAGLGLDEVQT